MAVTMILSCALTASPLFDRYAPATSAAASLQRPPVAPLGASDSTALIAFVLVETRCQTMTLNFFL